MAIDINLFEILAGWLWHIAPIVFFGAVIILCALPVWMRTKSWGPTWMVIVILASVFSFAVPGGEITVLLWFSIVAGIFYVLYRVFVKKISPFGGD